MARLPFFLENAMSINQNTAKANSPELPKKERFIRREQVLDRLNIGSTYARGETILNRAI